MLRPSLLLCALLWSASSAFSTPQQADYILNQEELSLPAGEQMQLATFAVGSATAPQLLWVEVLPASEEGAAADAVLRTSVWQEEAWTQPEELARGSQLFLNWADTPRMAVSATGSAMVTWLETLPASEEGKAKGYGIRYRWRAAVESAWSEAAWLHQDRSAREHGFVSLMTLPDGAIQAVFLQAGASLEEPTMLRSVVIAADGTKSAERLLDERVCDCCDTSGIVLPNGKSMVVYRNRDEEEVRDIQYVREDPLQAEGEQAEALAMSQDQWKIAGCPVNGPVVTNQGRFVLVAWYTQFQGKLPQVKSVLSRSGGTKFAFPTILAGGHHTIGRVAAAYFAEGESIVAWLEKTNDEGMAQWVLRKLPVKGLPGPKRILGPVKDSRDSGFLSLRATEDGVLAVWRDTKAEQGLRLKMLTLEQKEDR